MKRKKFQVMLLTAILICALCFGITPKQNSITDSIVGYTVLAEEYDDEDESYDDEWSNEDEDEDSENTSSGDVELQVIQVLAKGKNPITGELYEMDKFVAGKSTVIRAQFPEERDIPQDGSLVLTISKDGSELLELLPIGGGEADNAIFAPRDIQDINSWKEGEYEFVLNEDGEEVSTRSAEFKEAKKIKVLVVPVLANYGGEVVGCEGEWMTDGGSLNDRVNPAPYGMEGKDWYDRGQLTKSSRESVERAETHTGSLIGLDQVPFNARTMQALPSVGSWMGTGSSNPDDYWVTSDIWNHLFSTFVYNDPNVQPYANDEGYSDSGEDSYSDDDGSGEDDESDGDE